MINLMLLCWISLLFKRSLIVYNWRVFTPETPDVYLPVFAFTQATLQMNIESFTSPSEKAQMEEAEVWFRTRHLNEHKSCASRACKLLSGIKITAGPRVSRLISLQPWFGKRLAQTGGPKLGWFWKHVVWGLRPTVFLGPDAIRNIQHISYTVNFSWTASVPMKIH